jgi:hypothetical protein
MSQKPTTRDELIIQLRTRPAWRFSELQRMRYPVGLLFGPIRAGTLEPIAPHSGLWPTTPLIAMLDRLPVDWKPHHHGYSSEAAQRYVIRENRRWRERESRRRVVGPPRVRRMPYFRAWLATLPPGTVVRPVEVARMFGLESSTQIQRLFRWAAESGALIKIRRGYYAVPSTPRQD